MKHITCKLLTHTAVQISKPLKRSDMDWLQSLHWIGGGEIAVGQLCDPKFWDTLPRHKARWAAFQSIWMSEAKALGLNVQDADFLWALTRNLASETWTAEIKEGAIMPQHHGFRHYNSVGIYHPVWMNDAQGRKELARARGVLERFGWAKFTTKSINDGLTQEEQTYVRIGIAMETRQEFKLGSEKMSQIKALYDHVTEDGIVNLIRFKRLRRIL